MICPYIYDEENISQWRYEYDEAGNNTFAEQIHKTNRKEHICEEYGCCAYSNGKCEYFADRSDT